jgi:hypothetical protein
MMGRLTAGQGQLFYAYAKKAYDNWMTEASKIGEMYAAAARDVYKPVEQAVAKRTA